MKNNAAIFILPFALLSLLLGIVAGWQRINWDIPVTNLAGNHGALMSGSFLGTLICLERSIIQSNKWWRLLPFINGLSILLFLFDQPQPAYAFLIVGSAGLVVLMGIFLKSSPNLSHAILLMGAFAWFTGNLILFNQHAYPAAVKWWMLFLLWTIFGERLELSSMLPISLFKKGTLYAIIAINVTGALLPFHWHGNEVSSISFILISIWLYAFDMSRYSVKLKGQHRYSAILLMTGYAWLLTAGMWMLFWPNGVYAYDAALHSFFLGFVFSMIFAHVPIIFPGIFKINISLYHPILFMVFILFQTSLITRIAGDALLNNDLRKWGAMINGISILLFFASTAMIVISRLQQKEKKHVTTGR
jgi:hypothetical protein